MRRASNPWICDYDNIDITLQAINAMSNNVVAGFVSWAQVCSGSLEFVTFPDYKLDQHGVLLETDSTDGDSNASEDLAQSLLTYMNLGSGAWNTWLASSCYGAI